MLLWQEYKARHPDGWQYSAFCRDYGPGSVARSGDAPRARAGREAVRRLCRSRRGASSIATPARCKVAQIFVAVLGASHYTYVEASLTQTLADWLGAHVRALEFFGGVPQAIVSGQPQERRAPRMSLRARSQPELSGLRRTLRRRDPAGPGAQAPRQGQGRSGRAGDRALDPGAAAPPHVLLPERAQRGPARSSSSATTIGLCRARPAHGAAASSSSTVRRFEAAAGAALRVRDLEEGQGHPRLSRRGRATVLLGALSADRQERRSAHQHAHTIEVFYRGQSVARHLRRERCAALQHRARCIGPSGIAPSSS